MGAIILKIRAFLGKVTDVLTAGRAAGLWQVKPRPEIPQRESSLGK